jgi:arylsulfatase A-like enzyme
MGRLRARAAWIGALALMACGRHEVAADPPCGELHWDGRPRRASVVLVVGDTLRPDPFGVYGGAAETPAFDAFARENLWFPRAFSQAPWTKPSVASLFTGLYPSQHRVTSVPEVMVPFLGERAGPALEHESDGLPPGLATLAEVLRESGYRTGALVTNPWLGADFGFAQGFEHYDDSLAAAAFPGPELARAALAWLEGIPRDQPYFLYVHSMDAHRPYRPLSLDELLSHAAELEAHESSLPESARKAIARVVPIEGGLNAAAAGVPVGAPLIALAYRKGVEQFDRGLGDLLRGLATRDPEGGSAVIVTSDHGEALYTRGYGNHGRGLYDDELAIPLAMRLPGVSADVPAVACTAGLIDLMPTLCDLLGLACPEQLPGRSLLAPGARTDERAPRYLVSEGVGNQPRHRALRGVRHKLLFEPGVRPDGRGDPWALFDLERDPGEARDLLARSPDADAATRALAVLQGELGTAVPPFQAPEARRVEVDEALAERLRELGYLGEPTDAAAGEPAAEPAAKP